MFVSKEEGYQYKGMWTNGAKNGQGILTRRDQEYIGDFVNGIEHGEGSRKWIDEQGEQRLYEGTWKEGEMSGFGQYTWQDKTYKG